MINRAYRSFGASSDAVRYSCPYVSTLPSMKFAFLVFPIGTPYCNEQIGVAWKLSNLVPRHEARLARSSTDAFYNSLNGFRH
jgi:hypothetical protein